MIIIKKETDRQTETETERQRQTDSERETDRQTEGGGEFIFKGTDIH